MARVCAAVQVLLSLLVPAPDWLLQGLFTDPFAQALQLVRLSTDCLAAI
jgi:hypothetical protein